MCQATNLAELFVSFLEKESEMESDSSLGSAGPAADRSSSFNKNFGSPPSNVSSTGPTKKTASEIIDSVMMEQGGSSQASKRNTGSTAVSFSASPSDAHARTSFDRFRPAIAPLEIPPPSPFNQAISSDVMGSFSLTSQSPIISRYRERDTK